MQNFECKLCDYSSSSKRDFNRHVLTRKHKYRTLTDKNKDITFYTCDCGKKYTARNSLWYHKKRCNFKKKEENTKIVVKVQDKVIHNNDTTMVSKILKDNEKLHDLVMEQQKQIFELAKQPRNINSNNRFNLQIFLNEQCKNAMTLKDFVDSLTIQLDDLEYTKNNGLTQGITEVFVNGLKELDIYNRPIHCTDKKRSTMYIKEDHEWEKDNENEKIKDSISTLNKKHIIAIKEWEKAHPNWEKNDRMTDEYMKMVKSVTSTNEQTENLIIKQVAKEVMIDKDDKED
jgi:hypothetical protein